MPKPYMIRRPSGLYVRFLVPADLRSIFGTRFLVRRLHPSTADGMRLAAARMAVALSQAFARARQGDGMGDFDDLLAGAQKSFGTGKAKEWSADSVTVTPGGGVVFKGVKTDGPQDAKDFADTANQLAAGATPAPTPPPAPADTPMVSMLIDEHLADLERRKLAKDTITESRHTLRIFLGVVGNKPVGQVDRNDLRAFWDGVRWWPANATVKPEYKGLSVQEIIAKGKAADVPEPAPNTMKKHRQRLSVFFNDLVEAGTLSKSPITSKMLNVESGESETGRPFTDDELRKIFDPATFMPWAKKYPHRFWGPILGLYSGARVTEVAQLYLADIEQVGGVWGFHINNRFHGQKIKNAASRRFVPIAQPVLDAGFLAFVDDQRSAKRERLFPALPVGINKDTGKVNGTGYGRQLSRQFGAYLKKLGVEDGVAFHAFRHTFATALHRAKKTELDTARITGHKVAGSVLAKHYIDEPTLPERVETLKAFVPPVSVPAYDEWKARGGRSTARRVKAPR